MSATFVGSKDHIAKDCDNRSVSLAKRRAMGERENLMVLEVSVVDLAGTTRVSSCSTIATGKKTTVSLEIYSPKW